MPRSPFPLCLAGSLAACVHAAPPAKPVSLDVGGALHVEFPGPPEQYSTVAPVDGEPVAVATAKYFEPGDSPALLKVRIVQLGGVASLIARDGVLLCDQVRAQLAEIAASLDARPASLGPLPGCAFQVELRRMPGRRPRSLLRQGAHVSLRVAVGQSFVAVVLTAYERGRPLDPNATRAIERFADSTRAADNETPGHADDVEARGAATAETIQDVASAVVVDLVRAVR